MQKQSFPSTQTPQILTTGLLLSNGEYTTEAKPYAEICYSFAIPLFGMVRQVMA
jgi:hypothetical protein